MKKIFGEFNIKSKIFLNFGFFYKIFLLIFKFRKFFYIKIFLEYFFSYFLEILNKKLLKEGEERVFLTEFAQKADSASFEN